MRKNDEDRRPVGRPRRTWLERVQADMSELEIDREDVHDRNKRRQNVMKRKTDYKPIIIYRCQLKILFITILGRSFTT